jgi:hypothetical protein
MAGEHFENIPLELPKLDNASLSKKLEFLHDIGSDSTQKKLAKAIGKDNVEKILAD